MTNKEAIYNKKFNIEVRGSDVILFDLLIDTNEVLTENFMPLNGAPKAYLITKSHGAFTVEAQMHSYEERGEAGCLTVTKSAFGDDFSHPKKSVCKFNNVTGVKKLTLVINDILFESGIVIESPESTLTILPSAYYSYVVFIGDIEREFQAEPEFDLGEYAVSPITN